jgi:hypothetical protein
MPVTSVPHTCPALSLTNEYSDAVASERLYYKFFAEVKASMFHPPDDYIQTWRNNQWNLPHPSPH